jgi:predicted restriction endonuclease
MAKSDENPPENQPVEDQVREQTGQQEVQLRVDEREMDSAYANAFRTNATPEEVMIDFGVNLPVPQPQQNAPRQVVFRVSDRIVLNYYSAKRLAITLSNLIRQHEQQFGELELDVAKRRKDEV